MNAHDIPLPVLDRAIERVTADAGADAGWRTNLEQLDVRIERLDEQIKARPAIPPELQDQYREEIDAVTLKNASLTTELEQTKAALKQVNTAYKEEVVHTATLEQQLDDLERRVLGVLSRE